MFPREARPAFLFGNGGRQTYEPFDMECFHINNARKIKIMSIHIDFTLSSQTQSNLKLSGSTPDTEVKP